MSNFLGFESFLVPLGASIADVHNILKNAFSTRGWQVLTDNPVSTPTILEIIPPVTETIGGNGAYEVVRFTVAASSITLASTKRWITGCPQQVCISSAAAGAVTLTCTLNGVALSYTGTSGNTGIQNMLGLYDVIRSSNNATYTGWNWEVSYPATQNGNDGSYYIFGINKTIQPNLTWTVSGGAGGSILSNYVAPNTPLPEACFVGGPSLTTDLVNGFIYYLQVNARGLALATKTNAGFYGPVHACYGNNAAAMAYLPVDNQFLTPLELLVGWDDDANNTDSWARTAGTVWVLPTTTASLVDINDIYGVHTYPQTTIGAGYRRHRFQEVMARNDISNIVSQQQGSWSGHTQIQLFGSGMFWDQSTLGANFQVHRVKTTSTRISNSSFSGGVDHSTYLMPGFELEDWYKFRGTATNESLTLVSDTVKITTLASKFTVGDTSMALTNASNFASTGYIIIGNEALQYTSKSGNTLLGVTGGKYATLPVNHYPGDRVGQGLWFVIINGGAIFAGYSKPS